MTSSDAAELRSADIHPDDYPTVLAVRQFGELVKQRTNGRITVKVYAGGALGNEDDSIEQVKLGALAMARVSSAAMHNICQTTRVPSLPFLFRSKEHLHKVLDSEIGEQILRSCEAAGFVGLAWYDSGSRSMYTRNKPVKTLADAKGMKIRVQQSDLSVAMVEAMGGNATPMPMGEVYTSLKTGLVDAAENNFPSYESAHHYEVAKYYSMTEHTMTPEILIFSKRQWDKLAPEDQKILREAARESVPFMRKLSQSRHLIPVMLLIGAVLGSIYTGIATATEAAAVGVVGALILSALQGSLNRSTFKQSLLGATRLYCMI
ncbi:MAG: DctP family TRAP transporter solute-binding subunit, partial [Starkeya sp.]|nr:DctP family TRAP transporter solute-binding subunit [Starkeya sp.]